MFLLLDEILVRQQARWWLTGAAFGLVMIVQLGFSAEVLACTLTVAAIGVVVLVIARPHLVRQRLPYVVKAAALSVVLLAPAALWFGLVSRSGPEHMTGPNHPVSVLAGLSTDLAGLVVPTLNQHFAFGLSTTGDSFVQLTLRSAIIPDAAENGSYVGIPLLLLLAVGLFRFRRDALIRFSLVMAVLSLLLSMGSHLHVWGHETGIPLPFIVLTKLPFVQSEVASRYSLFMWLFIAISVAAILDRARRVESAQRRLHRQGRAGRESRRGPLPLFLVLFGLGVLSLVPAWPYSIGQVFLPTVLVRPTIDTGPVGSTLLTYPLARSDHNLPMVWQALDRF